MSGAIKTFRDLIVWQKAMTLVTDVYEESRNKVAKGQRVKVNDLVPLFLGSFALRIYLERRPALKLRLIDLSDMHPSLLWDDMIAAAVAVLDERGFSAPFQVALEVKDVPSCGSGQIDLQIVKGGVTSGQAGKVRRTYESHRLVELAAIAVAGLGLFAAGGHQIRDVALRGSSADYLVDDEHYLLEVSGRSRRSDFQAAWDARWKRLSGRPDSGFFVCVLEFETPAGRLAFGT